MFMSYSTVVYIKPHVNLTGLVNPAIAYCTVWVQTELDTHQCQIH